MTPSHFRDQVAQLAKTDTNKAAAVTEKINDPWFQAQAWADLSRHADDPLTFSHKAAKAAAKGKHDYQRSAVRAWEIAPLAERNFIIEARRSLEEALSLAVSIPQAGSRSESLMLLLQAAFKISGKDAAIVAGAFQDSGSSSHWRAERARKTAASMLNGEMSPREFFW